MDDWEWIENLQTQKMNSIDWLFEPTNIHNIFIIKLIFLINNNFFNLNFEFFNYFSILLIFIISIIFIKNEEIKNKIYFSLLIILIFSGKQFANFSQASNIAWTVCFLYIILFNYLFKKKELISIISCSFLIFISPLTFGLGYVLPLYILVFVYFHNLNKKIKANYIFFSIAGIVVSILLPKVFFSELDGLSFVFADLKIFLNIKYYITFFGVLTNVYLPWITGVGYLGTAIGVIQIAIIIFIIKKNYQKYGFESFKNLIRDNVLIFLGLIFALIVSFTRSDLQTIVAARYSVGSIVFQLGFWILIFNEKEVRFLKTNTFIKFLAIYVFISGMFFPYHGIHWQVKRHILNEKVLNCFKNNKETDSYHCNKLAYDILFYGGNWYNYENFVNQIKIFKYNRKSFYNF